MRNFNEIREDAKNVFFENYNFLKCYDFLYDLKNNELIPCDKSSRSHDSYISFIEYATVFDTAEINYLIEENYNDDDKMESIPKLSKIFDDWFEKFYNNITNSEYPTTLYGDYIHAEYVGLCY